MAFKTATQMAEMYEAAIEALVTGRTQSYSIAGRSFNRLDLSALEKLYQYWRSRAEESTFGNVSYADLRGNAR